MSLGAQAGFSIKNPFFDVNVTLRGPTTEGTVDFGLAKSSDNKITGYTEYTTKDIYFTIGGEVGSKALGIFTSGASLGGEVGETKNQEDHPVFTESHSTARVGIMEETRVVDNEGEQTTTQKETIRLGIDVKLFVGFKFEIFWERVNE